jgi:NAD-dependent dihydropyrimidine dehydrogenase PreA subunit
MAKEKIYARPNAVIPNKPLRFNSDICNGCNRCIEICLMDVLVPNPKKGKPPIIMYPDECWYDGCCVLECPRSGAAKMNHPLMQRVRFRRKDTGEHFRV